MKKKGTFMEKLIKLTNYIAFFRRRREYKIGQTRYIVSSEFKNKNTLKQKLKKYIENPISTLTPNAKSSIIIDEYVCLPPQASEATNSTELAGCIEKENT